MTRGTLNRLYKPRAIEGIRSIKPRHQALGLAYGLLMERAEGGSGGSFMSEKVDGGMLGSTIPVTDASNAFRRANEKLASMPLILRFRYRAALKGWKEAGFNPGGFADIPALALVKAVCGMDWSATQTLTKLGWHRARQMGGPPTVDSRHRTAAITIICHGLEGIETIIGTYADQFDGVVKSEDYLNALCGHSVVDKSKPRIKVDLTVAPPNFDAYQFAEIMGFTFKRKRVYFGKTLYLVDVEGDASGLPDFAELIEAES